MITKPPKPTKGSWTKQCNIDSRACRKLFPGTPPGIITFRSSWELIYARWCEINESVRYWSYECMEIPYCMPDGTSHRYYPDFLIEYMDGSKAVIEVKPKTQCVRPINENSWLWAEYKRNMCKWAVAKKFCEDRGWAFKIITENTINRL